MAGRLTLEFLGGSVLGILGSVPGSALMLEAFLCKCSDQKGEFLLGMGLAALGLSSGAVLGVLGGGTLLGGEGWSLATLIGGTWGTLVGVLGAVIVGFIAGPALLIPLIGGPIVGAMIGFEGSHAKELAAGPASTASAL